MRQRRQTSLITGASRGLGLELARFLARRGQRLVITARDPVALGRVQQELSEHTEILSLPGDIRDSRHRIELVREAGDRLDLLVNNASDLGTSPLPPLLDYDLGRLREVFEVNVVGPLALTQLAAPALRAATGLVVNISSDASRGGYPGWGGYGASKAALDLITLTVSQEERGFASVSVDPGDMRTDMHQDAFPGVDISDRPLPSVTLPFWAWLLDQPRDRVNGLRFEAQSEVWELA